MFGCKLLLYILPVLTACMITNGPMLANTDSCSPMHVVAELSLISLHWFLTIFASVVHMKVLLRIWDLFFYEGSTVLFQITMGMLKMKVCQAVHTCLTNSCEIHYNMSINQKVYLVLVLL